MSVEIVEIMGRSEQGITLPFICRGDDDLIYFVKGIGAGRRSQVCEWIAGNLALKLGLPIAPFEIVEVPIELVEGNPQYSDLGAGPAFGSLKQSIMELNYAGIELVPDKLQRDVLAFDWWVRNEDRTLSEIGGNPNLFWEPEQEQLVVIDHNQAFDHDFSVAGFLNNHVFSGQRYLLFGDVLHRQEYEKEYQEVLKQWHNIQAGIPAEWKFLDAELSIPANIDLNTIFNTLKRCNTQELWNQL